MASFNKNGSKNELVFSVWVSFDTETFGPFKTDPPEMDVYVITDKVKREEDSLGSEESEWISSYLKVNYTTLLLTFCIRLSTVLNEADDRIISLDLPYLTLCSKLRTAHK